MFKFCGVFSFSLADASEFFKISVLQLQRTCNTSVSSNDLGPASACPKNLNCLYAFNINKRISLESPRYL